MTGEKPVQEKGYLRDDKILLYFRYSNEKADETLRNLIRDMTEIIGTISETHDPELAMIILYDWKSRIDHLFGTVFRRTIEALTSTKTIKKLLDQGHSKDEVYFATAGAMAKTIDEQEFNMIIQDINRIMELYYGIDDFIKVLESVAKRVEDHYEKDVF